MSKEETLSEKEINASESETIDARIYGPIIPTEDVKQFIEEILNEIEKKIRFHRGYRPSQDSEKFAEELEEIYKIIKQKSGFDLE